MNERIRELAHEAGLPTYNPEGVPTKLEKFAELIVRECVGVVDDAVNYREPASTYVGKIKQHFGVEE